MTEFDLPAFEALPGQPFEQTYLSKVIAFEQGGKSFVRKVNNFVIDESAEWYQDMVEFLLLLKNEGHPKLLCPTAIGRTLDNRLAEDYPFVAAQTLHRQAYDLRSRLKQGSLAVASIVDIGLQTTEGLSFIHDHGFVHQDVRRTNVFAQVDDDNVDITLFDYNSLCRPYQEEGDVDGRQNFETPPEAHSGNYFIDARYDVYQVGYMLHRILHDSSGGGRWEPLASLPDDLVEVIGQAMSSQAMRFNDAGELHQALAEVQL